MTRGKIWSDDDTASLRNLKMLGRTDAEIARILGYTRETVVRRRKMLGVATLDTAEARRIARELGRFSGWVSTQTMRRKRLQGE